MKTENINGFIWAVLDKEKAEEYYWDDREIFEIRTDGTEGLIIDSTDIALALMNGFKLGIEIGAKEELKADYLETVERNNENRTFEDWCLSKI